MKMAGEEQQPEGLPFIERTRAQLGSIATTAKDELVVSDNRLAMASVGLGVTALQFADRMRVSVAAVPTVAVNVLEETGSPVKAALAGGLTYGGWCASVGAVTTWGLLRYPRTVKAVEEEFPSFVGFFEDSLPGFESRDTEEQAAKSLPRRLGSSLLTRAARGYTVSGLGTTAYVSTAAAKGRERKDIRRLNLNASADGATAIGAVVLGVSEAIVQVGHKNPQLAETIQDWASDIRLWYGLAVLMMAQQFVATRLKRRKEAKNATP